MSSTLITATNLRSQPTLQKGNLTVPLFSFLSLLLTLSAVAADQFAAPLLYSSSPMWAVATGLLLVWRRGDKGFRPEDLENTFRFSSVRIGLFVLVHLALVFTAYLLRSTLETLAGTYTPYGWVIASLKLSVLLPTLMLLPAARWRVFTRAYAAEILAVLIVLFTFFPGRIFVSIWPWYGQTLGRFVFWFAHLLVPGLTYTSALTPTFHGPHLDVTILFACSGVSGVELFDCLFAFIAVLDWNRLRKGRALAAYFVGISVMLFGNALRIVTLVVLGNRGFAGAVANYHLSAGWIFFTVVFLTYLAAIYRQLLLSRESRETNSEGIPLSRLSTV